MKTLSEIKTEAKRLYDLCQSIPNYGDFSFPSWLLSLSEPNKWGIDVLSNEKRADCALEDASDFYSVFEGTKHETLAQEIQNGVYELVAGFREKRFRECDGL